MTDYNGFQFQNSMYKSLGNINTCASLPNCMNRFNNTRSDKDIAMYKQWVLGQQNTLPIAPQSSKSSWGIFGSRK